MSLAAQRVDVWAAHSDGRKVVMLESHLVALTASHSAAAKVDKSAALWVVWSAVLKAVQRVEW